MPNTNLLIMKGSDTIRAMKQGYTLNINKKSRIWELDFIRGFCILLMIMDHTLYDLAYIFKDVWFKDDTGGFWYWLSDFAKTFYFPWILRDFVWGLVVFLFIFICGISCSFSRSNFKRGLRLSFVALGLTAFTWVMDWFAGQENQFTIRFGILHMLAASILLYCFLRRLGLVTMLIVGLLTIATGIYFSYFPLVTSMDNIGVLIHTTSAFYSADYFPLLPWFGYFLIGAAIGPQLYEGRKSYFPRHGNEGWMSPVLFTGRHSLIFYILHQPVIYGILTIIGLVLFKQG